MAHAESQLVQDAGMQAWAMSTGHGLMGTWSTGHGLMGWVMGHMGHGLMGHEEVIGHMGTWGTARRDEVTWTAARA